MVTWFGDALFFHMGLYFLFTSVQELNQEKEGLLDRALRQDQQLTKMNASNTQLRKDLQESQLALEQLTIQYQTLLQQLNKYQDREWVNDSYVKECEACHKPFSVKTRRHHCRQCGHVFCNACSSNTAKLASSKKPERVCNTCYEEVRKASL
eukprot:m.215350 g.215350  ORF g.215350 m.215350 type:complete len:152 (-) comp16974_c1_seq12:464-919(-)